MYTFVILIYESRCYLMGCEESVSANLNCDHEVSIIFVDRFSKTNKFNNPVSSCNTISKESLSWKEVMAAC